MQGIPQHQENCPVNCISLVLQVIVCPFVLFLLAIVLSVLLRSTDSEYPFGIFKLFLHMKIHRNQIINISLFSHLVSDGGLFHHFELYLLAFSWVILLVAGQVVKKPGFCQFTLLFPLIHQLFHLPFVLCRVFLTVCIFA